MYTEEDYIRALEAADEAVEGPLTASEYRGMDIDGPSDRSIVKKYGSWNEAKEAAGLRTLSTGVNKSQLNKNVLIKTDHEGYYRIKIHQNRTRHTISVHRLVAVAEYGLDEVSGKVVHHKNDIPWDNRPENLELMSHGEHARHHREKDIKSGKLDMGDGRLSWED